MAWKQGGASIYIPRQHEHSFGPELVCRCGWKHPSHDYPKAKHPLGRCGCGLIHRAGREMEIPRWWKKCRVPIEYVEPPEKDGSVSSGPKMESDGTPVELRADDS